MKLLAAILALLLAGTAGAQQTLFVRGFLTGRIAGTTGPSSWMEGTEWGRFDVADGKPALTGELGIDWNPSKHFGAHVHGLARAEPEEFKGERYGLVAAFVEGRFGSEQNHFQIRGGQFFLPTSRENKGDLWSSPYTISFSALNTWMGQEVRPVGVDLEYRHTTASFNSLTIGATAFQDNDTMGTLLAWRGWTVGNRLPVYDELVPLPPLWSLPVFTQQNLEGSTPFRNDLDGMTGWAARAKYSVGDRGNIQITRLDNRGDYELYGDEYSWNTKFTAIGGEIGSTESTVLAAEYLVGYTAMGPYLDFLPGRPVIVDFDAWYALLSHKRGRNRFSARIEGFTMTDEDNGNSETSDEDGYAWTFAWLFELTPHLRTGLEFTQVVAESTMAAESGQDANTDGRSLLLEVRYGFWR